MTAHLYLLHFETPLHHAKHYLGSSLHLLQRLKQHESGDGARITEVLKEIGTDWTLAAAFQKTDPNTDIRQLEITAKRQKNASMYCPICTKNNRSPKGTIQIPNEAIRFTTNHKEGTAP